MGEGRRGKVWGNITRMGKAFDKVEIGFTGAFEKKVINGMSTSFWNDNWVGGGVVIRER